MGIPVSILNEFLNLEWHAEGRAVPKFKATITKETFVLGIVKPVKEIQSQPNSMLVEFCVSCSALQFATMDLDLFPCPHTGCSFEGGPQSLKRHLMECPYGMQEYISEFIAKKQGRIPNPQQTNSIPPPSSQNYVPKEQKSSPTSEFLTDVMTTGMTILQAMGEGVGKIDEE